MSILEHIVLWSAVAIMIGGMLWSVVLQTRYSNPFILKDASSEKKWWWATVLGFFTTFPALSLMIIFIFVGDTRSAIGLCLIPIMVAFPCAILWKYWELERTRKFHSQWNGWLHDPTKQKLMNRLRTGMDWKMFLYPKEYVRFFEEGFSDKISNQEDK
ncbi:MAG: hypothetical protein ILNGONEN_02307 [Syntrophorhabdaceae bacterium]|nr:hypothetical protein [Syntrophorhabdaceae bacterium]